MKKNKLSLKDLKIQSFVTQEKPLDKKTIKGGGTHYSFCSFEPCDCDDTYPFEPYK
ncbi:MAG: pinensin family lanthipeptide [Bacteroidota bacterium]